MPPVLTPQEIAQLEAEKAKAENVRDAMNAAIPQKQARAAELAIADGGFKKFFDYYNDDIIAKYDAERRKLNGQYIASPITEADVEGPASLDGSVRTTPTSPVTDIIRVPQFDGGPLIVDADNEAQHITLQAEVENALVNGYTPNPTFNPATAETDSALTALSTTLNLTDPTNTLTFAPNQIFVVMGSSQIAVVKVTSVTIPPTPPPPNQVFLGIQLIVPPTGTIAAGADLANFTGFTNGERASKTASDPDLQPLMDYLIDQLELQANARISNLNAQIAAIAANQDPDGTAAFATATSNANTSKNFLTNYLLTTDISNTGMASLSTERGTRGGQITARVAQIVTAYTGQTENYFDRRYSMANDRANTSRGSLRLQYATEAAAASLGDYAAGAQASIDAINALLP